MHALLVVAILSTGVGHIYKCCDIGKGVHAISRLPYLFRFRVELPTQLRRSEVESSICLLGERLACARERERVRKHTQPKYNNALTRNGEQYRSLRAIRSPKKRSASNVPMTACTFSRYNDMTNAADSSEIGTVVQYVMSIFRSHSSQSLTPLRGPCVALSSILHS